jgi:hypothetical protein
MDKFSDPEYIANFRARVPAGKKKAKAATPCKIEDAAGQKPRLLIENCNPDRTVAALRDTLAESGGLYDRGVPVRMVFDQTKQGIVAQVMTPDAVVLTAHTISRPYIIKSKPDGTISEENARLPRSFAVMLGASPVP